MICGLIQYKVLLVWVIFLVGRFVCCGLLGEVARLCELLLPWLVLGFLVWWFGWFWVGFCWWSYLCALICGLWFRFLRLGDASSRILVLDLGFRFVGFSSLWFCAGRIWYLIVWVVLGCIGWVGCGCCGLALCFCGL